MGIYVNGDGWMTGEKRNGLREEEVKTHLRMLLDFLSGCRSDSDCLLVSLPLLLRVLNIRVVDELRREISRLEFEITTETGRQTRFNWHARCIYLFFIDPVQRNTQMHCHFRFTRW